MAGTAISPLSKISGEVATAIACAAFCIPTSMTIVRRTARRSRNRRASSDPPAIASRISVPAARPSTPRFSRIVEAYCTKKTAASSIRAGKATRPSSSCTRRAARGRQCLKSAPQSIGRNSRTMFCTSSFPTGSSMVAPACTATKRAAKPITSGIVKSVMRLLKAVSVTERATSPLASIEKTFDELPPGQQATSSSPRK